MSPRMGKIPARQRAGALAGSLAVVLMIAGCASAPPGCTRLPLASGNVPANIGYCLQSTASAPAFVVQQRITLRFGERQETLIADLENNAAGLIFTGLSPLGLTLFQASYDNHAVRSTHAAEPRLPPELLLAVLQLALWPKEAVQRGLEVSAMIEDQLTERRITVNDQLWMRVRHDGTPPPYRRLVIELPAVRLNLEIEALPDFVPATAPGEGSAR